MTPAEAYQLYLMGQMENRERARQAAQGAGFHESALQLAAHFFQYIPFVEYEISQSAHHPFLGRPMRIDPGNGTERVARVAVYQASLLPPFELRLSLAANNFVTNTQLARPPEAPTHRLERAEIIPWETVEGDIPRFCQEARLVESWMPVKTFCCTLLGSQEEWGALFRFGLLQDFYPWQPDWPRDLAHPAAYHYRASP